MKKSFTLFFLLAGILKLNAQSPPSEMHFSQDGHMMLMGDMPVMGLYNQAEIKSYYLYFSQPDYWQQLEDNYWAWNDEEILAKLVVDGKEYDSVGVRFKGQSSFQQVQNSQKKSFSINVDFVRPDQKVKGYSKLNLNNAFDDPSFIREIFYETMIRKHIPAAKVSYARLFINDQDWGLYVNVQQLNKKFYKEWYVTNDGSSWRADRWNGLVTPYGDGTGSLNYLGTDTMPYYDQYILKSYSVANPWQSLIHACDVLNNTPLANLPDELPAVMDVDRALWFLASEILFSDDDSYIRKGRMDYYVYWEKETGRIAPQEYDGNTVMNPSFVNWSAFYNEDNATYPLMNKLFKVPEYRQRYLAHLRTLINEYFAQAKADSVIDSYKNKIDALVQADQKKLYTYNDFINEVAELKSFVAARRNFLYSNAEVAQTAPVISDVAWFTNGIKWDVPIAFQNVTVNATVNSSNGINKVNLYYSNQIVGNFTRMQMFDDGAHNDQMAGDGIFGVVVPGQTVGAWNRFYVEAAANDMAKTVSYEPAGAEHNVYAFITGTTTIHEEEDNTYLSICPNPSSGKFNVIMDEKFPIGRIEIFDIVGQKVRSVSPASAQFSIDLSDQPKGIYFVQVSVNNSLKVRKIVVQ